MLLERRDDPAVVVVRHVRFAGFRVADAARGGERRRRGLRDPAGEVLQGRDAAVVAAGGDVGDEDEPLSPVIEHDRSIDREEPDRGARGVVGVGCGMTVEEAGGLVREVPHQPPRERRQVGETRPADRTRRADERLARRSPVGDRQGQLSGRILDPQTGAVEDQGGRRVAGHEGVPPPAFGTLDRFQQDAGSRARDGGEQADRGGHVGQQLGPHRNERPLAGERLELDPVRMDIELRCQSTPPTSSSDHLGLGHGMSPGMCPGARRARCERN